MKGPKMSFLLHFLVLFSVTAFFAEAAKEAEEGSYSANYDPQWARINTPSGFERRGQQAPRVFWRCYFNAVSCF